MQFVSKGGHQHRASILLRIALRSLAQNPARTVLSLAGIFLSATLVSAVLITMTSLDRSLYENTAESEGNWYCWSGAASDAAVKDLCEDDLVSAVAVSRELGAALLDGEAGQTAGAFALAVVELPRALKGSVDQADALVKIPDLIEGRMPIYPDEIVLSASLRGTELVAGQPVDAGYARQGRAWSRWGVVGGARGTSGAKSDGPIELGSTITLDLGTLYLEDGSATNTADERPYEIEQEGGTCIRQLGDTVTRSYTVVGFRLGLQDYQEASLTAAERGYTVGITCPGAAESLSTHPTSQSVWACCDGYRRLGDFRAGMQTHFQNQHNATEKTRETCVLTRADYQVHWSLVHYVGLFNPWRRVGGVWLIAWLLVGATAATAVSLIYSSLAFAVRERTRQYGLLASQGATARQLSRIVMTETLLLGAVAIPLGMLMGAVGVSAIFRTKGDAFAYLLDGGRGPSLCVVPDIMLRAGALLVLVLVLSAWVPARRAGAAAPVDAVRYAGETRIGHAVRREIDLQRRRGKVAATVGELPSLFVRFAGVSGFLAHRNLLHLSSRGLALSLSLAASFSLFVTSGIISKYLGVYDDIVAAQGLEDEGDIVVCLGLNLLPGDSEASAVLDRQVNKVIEEASSIEGVRVQRVERLWQMQVRIPASMISPELRESMARRDDELAQEGTDPLELNAAHFTDGGDYVGPAEVHVVDDETWRKMLRVTGFESDVGDEALAVNLYHALVYDKRFGTYRRESLPPFIGTGQVKMYDLRTGHELSDLVVQDGRVLAWEPGSGSASLNAEERGLTHLDDAFDTTWQLSVVGMTTHMMEPWDPYGSIEVFPVLVIAQHVFARHAIDSATAAYVVLNADRPHTAIDKIEQCLSLDHPDVYEFAFSPSSKVKQVRDLTRTMRLYANLFSLITVLISVASVFNTLSNSVALRIHDFAVLGSVGMGPKAFREMIACECVSYAINGLVLGMSLSLLVDVGLWYGFGLVFDGVGLLIPWGHVALATVGMVLVLVVSIAYALRKTSGTSIVKALRAEVS